MIKKRKFSSLSLAAAMALPLLMQSLPATASEPFLGQIKVFGFNFAPRGWALCEGQILPINQYQSLYSLLGTTYGGDGRTTFALPDLRGRAPVHPGSSIVLGQSSGSPTNTLTVANMPNHTHSLQLVSPVSATLFASGVNGNQNAPSNHSLAPGGSRTMDFQSAAPDVLMSADSLVVTNDIAATVDSAGAGQSHNNMQPYLAVNYSIAIQGLFPSRN